MSKKLEGKIALVTGGTTGIGYATAKRFIEEGAFVYITGRRQAELEEAARTLGSQAAAVQGDVSNLADLDRLYAQIQGEKGRLDVVFANAGGGEFVRLGDITEEQFDKWFGINVKGLLFTVQKALPLMPNGAAIVLNASVAGSRGLENMSVYSATKAAVRSLARGWTLDLKERGIRVNVVSPGPIRTPIMSSVVPGKEEEFLDAMAARVPLGRVGEPEEVASAVTFLASSEGSFVAGSELFVDGGIVQV